MLAYCEERDFLGMSVARSRVTDAVSVVMEVNRPRDGD